MRIRFKNWMSTAICVIIALATALPAFAESTAAVPGTAEEAPYNYNPEQTVGKSSIDKPMISFIFDNGYSDLLTTYKPIFDSFGYKGSASVYVDALGQTDRITANQVKALSDEGWEILSQSKTNTSWGIGWANTPIISDEAARSESVDSKVFLSNLGIQIQGFVMPRDFTDKTNYKEILAQTYEYAFVNPAGMDGNSAIVNPDKSRYNITRRSIDGRTLDEVKGFIDTAIQKKQWLVFYTTKTSANFTNPSNFTQLLQYIQNKSGAISVVNPRDVLPPNRNISGNAYYVAADGTGFGFGEADAMSLKDAAAIPFKSGDKLLFKSGDIFYGELNLKVNAETGKNFTVSSYGHGDLPTISAVKIVNSGWVQEGDFYKFDLTQTNTYEGLKESSRRYNNVAFMEADDGVKYGVRKQNAETAINKYDFYCDDTHIYVKTNINPYIELGQLKLAVHADLFRLSSNMEVSGLRFQYAGGHGININRDSTNVYVHDNVIEDIGGSDGRDRDLRPGEKFTKLGNGIEFFNGASNIVIERNIIRNTYDVGFTLQGTDGNWDNIIVRNNIFSHNTQAFESWTAVTTSTYSGITNFEFVNNLSINTGRGWGTLARPDLKGGGGQVKMTEILFYGYDSDKLDMNLSHNVYFNPLRVYTMPYTTVDKFVNHVQADYNRIYMTQSDDIVFSDDDIGQRAYDFSEWKSTYALDGNSLFTALGDEMTPAYQHMIDVAYHSDDFDAILQAAQAAGIELED
ncbi:MAG: type sorting protein [Paenibacillaceae bacterium]|jgi:hypothetical protein|nr:type sorting protein [Paenibacillaceae bacterium]